VPRKQPALQLKEQNEVVKKALNNVVGVLKENQNQMNT
jgi:hypothetical protein